MVQKVIFPWIQFFFALFSDFLKLFSFFLQNTLDASKSSLYIWVTQAVITLNKVKKEMKKNILLVAIGTLLIVIGFICLAQGPAENPVSLTVAPMILIFAYLVVIPIGILWGGKSQKK